METGLMLAMLFIGMTGPIAAWGMWDSWLRHKAKLAKAASDPQVERLTQDKAQLKDQVALLEDRLSVLERIATDPARRTEDEIEALR